MSEIGQPDFRHHPRHAGDAFPLAPQALINAYLYYWHVTHEQQQTSKESRMAEVNSIVGDFCDSFIQPSVYSAAMLMPLMDKLDDPLTSRNAYRALKVYFEESVAGEQDDEYTLGMLSDRQEIAVFWQESIATIKADHLEIAPALHAETKNTEIPQEYWMHAAQLIHPEKMLDLLERVNLESLLIQSAELLQWLSSERAVNNGETFGYIYAAESIFAPICEIVGFDGLAMALQSKCAELRFEFIGESMYVTRAASIIDGIGSHDDIERSVQTVFEMTLGDTIHEQVLKHSSPHNIIIGEGITEEDTRVVWRVKSVGSTAKKLARNSIDTTPMDILGATLIVKDEDMLAESLGKIIARIDADVRATMKPSFSRDYAIHVRGDIPYIQTVMRALGYTTIDEMASDVDVSIGPSDGYRVAKVTFLYSELGKNILPVELQINTERDRIQARIGSAAHLLFKFSSSRATVDPSALERIRERKQDIGHNNLVPASRLRAQMLKQMIANTRL